MSQIVGKVQKRGEESAPKVKKSKIPNLGFLIKEGGRLPIFRVFSNVNEDLNTSVEQKKSLVLGRS